MSFVHSAYFECMAADRLGERDNYAVRRGTFLLFLLLVTAAFIGLIWDFMMACFWASILAIVFNGVNTWLLARFPGRRNLASVGTLLFVLIVVVTPIFFVTLAVINETQTLYSNIESGELSPQGALNTVRGWLPRFEEWLSRFGIAPDEVEQRLAATGSKIVAGLGDFAVTSTQNAINVFIQFTLMMYILFFLVRDGASIVRAIKSALPIGDEIEEEIFKRFASVSRATLKGTLVVAVTQGTMGGITFALLGIPAATLWGVVMIFLSLLPVGGSAIVWFPTAVILFIQGHIWKALILVIIGSLFIGLIDNVLRPRLVSRDTQMPDYLVLLATLGGIALFGLTGFIIGPVIAALFITCWEITGKLFGGDAR